MGKPFFDSEGMLVVNAVEYFVDGRYRCACPNFNRFRNLKASNTYCNCCAGHFKFHYEIMLGVPLKLIEIVHSPLEEDGTQPCIFKYCIEKTTM